METKSLTWNDDDSDKSRGYVSRGKGKGVPVESFTEVTRNVKYFMFFSSESLSS